MDSKKLEILMTAVNLGSFSKASEMVGYTQSGLTHLINGLEREIGMTLIRRDHSGIAPACRALIAPIEMATGKQAYFCGKPNPLMMRTGLKMLNCHSAEAVMVGDRMDTDVISGMESGMSTVLVLSGVSTRESLRTYAYRPSIVLDGVGDIAAMARVEKK